MYREKFLGFFLKEYTNLSYITRQRVTLLLWTHILFLPVIIVYFIVNLLRDYPQELAGILIIDFVFIAVLTAGLALIKAGKFSLASALDVAVITALAVTGQYVRRYVQAETGYNGFAVIMYGVMVFTGLFSSRFIQGIVAVIFTISTVALHIFASAAADPSIYFNLLSNTLNNIIIIIVIFCITYNNRSITDRALEFAQQEIEVNSELNRSLEQKVHNRTLKLAEEREALNIKNRELEEIKNTLIQRNAELEAARKNAEESNTAKNRFLATLSHELRTPLNGIIGISSLMLDSSLTDESIRALRMIQQSGENLFYIIQDLLDFTTIENNQISIKNSYFSIDELMDHIVTGLEEQIKNKNLLFQCEIEPEKAVIFSDKTRIVQIIFNLVTNSIKYTQIGSIKLRVNIDRDITIQVSDSGIGIPEDKIDSIFKAFTRIDSDYVKAQSGLGLGLSIVSQIVQMMNGTIRVESEPGKGSTFTVKLPLEKYSQPRSTESPEEICDSSILNRKRILIIEDNAINRFYFTSILSRAGAYVDESSNGREALHNVDLYNYDIILMDLNMPDFDGFLLTRIIRNTDNPNCNTLIIALSANAYRDHIKMCLDAGMNEFIGKPVEREQFISTLCALLQKNGESELNSKTFLSENSDA